ncbi:parallel beta-helix repeat protein [Methanococcus maripaludis]|uniref:Parallel beta-helix repeat protein n=2 Tax=Methanococcus maripaludis TaxID=39152 RepID=A0A7J9NH72_METMI|nr:parallel beta-helix repeat protein [Methanococcus maripaludis]
MSMSFAYAAAGGEKGTNTVYVYEGSLPIVDVWGNDVYQINESGRYLLNESLTMGIQITADDVTLDGNGYNLTNKKSFGVQAYNCSGVTVKDMYIFDCKAAGIALGGASNCMVEKNYVTGCAVGINVWGIENECGSTDNKIINNKVYNNTNFGIRLAIAGEEGGELGSEGNKIHANTVFGDSQWDIYVNESLNDVSGNKCDEIGIGP